MAKIVIKSNRPPSEVITIDTGTNSVEIKDAFLGIQFETADGEKLVVCMRDSGFEVSYSGDYGTHGFEAGRVSFNNGEITPMGKPFS